MEVVVLKGLHHFGRQAGGRGFQARSGLGKQHGTPLRPPAPPPSGLRCAVSGLPPAQAAH